MLKVRDLTVLHPVGQELLDISFQLEKGTVTAIIGPNSSGKSLLGRVIVDPAIERKGEVVVNHLNTLHDPHKSKFQIGYAPATPALEPYLTGYEQLDFIGSVFALSPAERSKRIIELAKDFNIAEDIYRLIELMGPGERKKLSLACSLIHRPGLVVWDEPTAFLDPTDQQVIRSEIKKLVDDKTAVLLISNDLRLVEEVAEEIIILANGSQVMTGNISQLKNQTSSQTKELGEILERALKDND